MADELLSMKDIADRLKVSKQRVYRCIKANNIKEVHRQVIRGNNVLMYDNASLKRIRELISTSSEVHQNVHQEALYEVEIKHLKSRVESQEKQIKELNARLKELNENLKTSQKTLDQEQQLHMKTLKRNEELEEQRTLYLEQKKEEQEEKKSFWKRLFG